MRFRPNRHVYRGIVLVGLATMAAFRMRLSSSGEESLPQEEVRGWTRTVAPGRGAVLAVTHFGYLDFAFAQRVIWHRIKAHPRFMVTKKHASKPLYGAVCDLCDHVVVDRANGAPALEASVEKLRAGEYICVFPEGGVSVSWTVRKLKTGAVRMAQQAQVPVIPVSVWGGHRGLTRGRGGLKLRNLWGLRVHVHVGEPLDVGPDEDVAEATEELRRRLQAGIDHGIEADETPAESGVWWLPAHRGGGAVTEAEQERLYEAERERYRVTG
ncbi:lysophospholipid acyltransferase family protein [Nesterenkonia marinintestina]|uniref:lysophospholipid acyltransferase family protein n=1 Tax=Nesterenkonia marinintestina TaxID=2979865 RepID=UPI0021C16C1D|nr:lysophospholipid acyltransferase family protein [Nesterenkonia sp. GX14115]